MKKAILFVLLSLSLTACDSEDDNQLQAFNPIIAPENENLIADLSYGNDPQQKLDLYLPAGRETDKTKVFIIVHGGGWFEGDKSQMNSYVILLRSTFPDYAIANVNYRLGTAESLGYPKQLNDLQKVVSFLNANTAKYHVGKQFSMIGISAGAHLAMLYSYAQNTNNQVKAVCSILGPTDFSDPEYAGNTLFTVGLNYLVGDYPSYEENPALYNAVSPVKKVKATAPKTLMLYGDADPLIPNTQGGILKSRLDEFQIYNEYYLYPGAGHGNWPEEVTNDMNLKIVNFFKNNFK